MINPLDIQIFKILNDEPDRKPNDPNVYQIIRNDGKSAYVIAPTTYIQIAPEALCFSGNHPQWDLTKGNNDA